MIHLRQSWLVFFLPGVLSCDEPPAADQLLHIPDSIPRIENHRPLLGQNGWLISDHPIREIGQIEGNSPEYSLFSVQGATKLPDGGYVVANRGTNELRVFDEEGAFVRSMGRTGQGPGEFSGGGSGISEFWRLGGDTLAAFDHAFQRLTLFSPEGELLRTIEFLRANTGRLLSPRLAPGLRLLGYMADDFGLPSDAPIRYREGTRWRQIREFLLVDTLGNSQRVDAIPGFSYQAVSRGGKTIRQRLRFGATTSHAVKGNRFFVSTAEGPAVLEYTLLPTPTLQRIIEWTPLAPREVTENDIETDKAEIKNRYLQITDPTEVARIIRETIWSERYPSLWVLKADELGFLWVKTFPRPGQSTTPWLVFDTEGSWVTSVEFPTDLTILEIGEGYILGVSELAYEVEQVREYQLRRRTP